MLLVSIHDVAPQFLDQVDDIRKRLAAWGVDKVTLLVVPNYHGEGPLWDSVSTQNWLRQQVKVGDELVLHGHSHRQEIPVGNKTDQLRARMWTASEGECLSRRSEEWPKLLAEGRKMIAEIQGEDPVGFVAPAWLEPQGFGEILRAAGFKWHEGGPWMEFLGQAPPHDIRVNRPVIGFSTRQAWRKWASIVWAHGLTPVYRRLVGREQAVRVALHPADVTSDAVMRCAETVIRRLAQRHRPELYRNLLST